MRVIDLESWPRRDHFRLFRTMQYPHINLSFQVDVSPLWQSRGALPSSATAGLVHVLAKAANRVPELRQRIRGKLVVEHDAIHPLIPVLGPAGMFSFYLLSYDPCYKSFAADAEAKIAEAKSETAVTEWPCHREGSVRQDDVLAITVVPWFSFTALSVTKPAEDSIPLLTYGRVVRTGDRDLLPLRATFRHGLVDGLHVAQFIKLEEEGAKTLAHEFM